MNAPQQTLPRHSASELHWYESIGWARRHARQQSLRRRGATYVIIASQSRWYAAILETSLNRYDLPDDFAVIETVVAT